MSLSVCIFLFNFDTNLSFIVYIDYIYVLCGPGGLCWAATKAETTPDASFRASANGTFFFVLILTCFFMSIYVVYMLYMHQEGCVGQRRFMKAQTMPEASFGP